MNNEGSNNIRDEGCYLISKANWKSLRELKLSNSKSMQGKIILELMGAIFLVQPIGIWNC